MEHLKKIDNLCSKWWKTLQTNKTIELKKLSMATFHERTSAHILRLPQYHLGSKMTPKWVRSPCTCVRNWADLLHFLLGQFRFNLMTLTPPVMSVSSLWRLNLSPSGLPGGGAVTVWCSHHCGLGLIPSQGIKFDCFSKVCFTVKSAACKGYTGDLV